MLMCLFLKAQADFKVRGNGHSYKVSKPKCSACTLYFHRYLPKNHYG